MVLVKHFIPKNIDLGILIMRLGVALLFIYGGVGKLFGILGGPGLEAFSGMVWGSMLLAVLVGVIELIAGFAVLLGFMSREAKLILAVIILVAMLHIHIPSGNLMQIFVHLMLFTNLLGLTFLGSGKYAIMHD